MRISCSWMIAMDVTRRCVEIYQWSVHLEFSPMQPQQELIHLPQVLEQLQKTNFFISQRVLQTLLHRFNKPKP